MAASESWSPPFQDGAKGYALAADLDPHPKNEEIYTNDDLSDLVGRIDEHGFKDEHRLLVTPEGTILSGHRRWRAARQLGIERVPVEVVAPDGEEEELLRILLANEYRDKTPAEKVNEGEAWETIEKRRNPENFRDGSEDRHERETTSDVGEKIGVSGRTYEKGKKVKEIAEGEADAPEPVRETAQEQWGAMHDEEQSIHGAYETVTEAEQEYEQEQQEELTETVDEATASDPEPDPPDAEPGDVWALGDHRLYCGDTADGSFRDLLPDGAAFGFADPPYNADAAEWDGDFEWRHDYLADCCSVTAVTPGIVSIQDFLRTTTMPYRWAVSAWIDNGMTRGELGFGNWIFVALFADADESLHRNSQDMVRVSVRTSENDDTDHKGRKPSELLAWLLDRFTEPGDVVVDPFLGSGTTLLMADLDGRVCIGGEVEPAFCEEIIARWEEQSGESAQLLEE